MLIHMDGFSHRTKVLIQQHATSIYYVSIVNVEGLVLHVCLPPGQVADNMAFPIVHNIDVSYNPDLLYTYEAFPITS